MTDDGDTGDYSAMDGRLRRRRVLTGGALVACAPFADVGQAQARDFGQVGGRAGGDVSGTLEHMLNMVHDNPGEPPFVTRYHDPAFLKDKGYTGQVPRTFLPCTVTYAAIAPGLMPPGSAQRRKVEAYAATLDLLFARAKAAGMPVYPFTDLLVLPKALVETDGPMLVTEAQRADHATLGGASLAANVLAPRTEQLLRAQIAEIFDRFPTIDGITTRFGETYLFEWPEYAGSSPARTPEEQARLIAILRDEVCVKRGKRLFYRTWDFGRVHTQPALYLAATDPVEPHPLLTMSIKHVGADFLRLQPFNQTLGIGRHRQIVEVSSSQAGIYGKNAHPYYFGQGVIDGWPRHPWIDAVERTPWRSLRELTASPLLTGVWTWSRGDGWRGPYTPDEMWVDLGEAVMRGFRDAPATPEPVLFAAAARAVTGVTDRDLPLLRDLSLLSASASLAGQDTVHMTPAEWNRRAGVLPKDFVLSGSYPQQWWCRDDGISAIDLTPVILAGKAAPVRAEKARAVADWQRIEALSRRIRLPDPTRQAFLEISCAYGRIKYALFEQIWLMQLLAAEAALSNRPLARVPMRRAIAAYDHHWGEWEALHASSPLCPTLYSDRSVKYVDAAPFREVLDVYRNQVA